MATSAADGSERGALARALRAVLELYPRGLKLFWLAPTALALVVLPELIQHVVEIQLGIYESREAFRAMADDPTRMAFGYAKLAGLFLAFLASARFWWARDHGRQWWDLRTVAWKRLVLGGALFIFIPAIPEFFSQQLGQQLAQGLSVALSLALLPALFLMLAGLFGDRQTSHRAFWKHAWPWALLTALLLVLAFVPRQWLHQMNHLWAMGAPTGLVWALMLFDSALVGLLAGLVGTAFYLGYAAFAASEVRRTADVTAAR
jgi:hypothetical protein